MKKRLFFVFLVAASFLFPGKISALSEFKSDYLTEYKVNSRGGTTVKQTVTLTNNFANIYPKEYHIEIKAPVQSITAWDEQGNILNSVVQQTDSTQIRLSFNQQVVGKGKSLTFYVEYQLLDFATKKGKVLEIVIPQISDPEAAESYYVHLYVPTVFGHLSYSSSQPAELQTLNGQTKYVFNKSQVKDNGIILAFGEFQTFDFSLSYFLNNPSSGPVKYEIPLPPETNYQEVIYSQISPTPNDINIDDNGNWMAEYQLEPLEKISIVAKGQAKIVSSPKTDHPYNQNQDLEKFLQSDTYWQSNSSEILSLATKLKTAKNIYNYVVNHLSYNYDDLANGIVERKGALKTLSAPAESVCSEFTDLFVTLCRAAGIPAREIEGYAYTNNPKIKPLSLKRDVLHAWPEYWDKTQSSWIQVDPTWENTTGGIDYFDHLDLNHFAFAIHGTESQYPPPPGSYQDEIVKDKTINVSFATNQLEQQNSDDINLSLSLKQDSLLLLNQKHQTVTFSNNSIAILKNVKVSYLGTELSLFKFSFQLPKMKNNGDQLIAEIAIVPPFGKEAFSIPKTSSILEWLFLPTYKLKVVSDQTGEQMFSATDNISGNHNSLTKIVSAVGVLALMILVLTLVIFRFIKVAKKMLF